MMLRVCIESVVDTESKQKTVKVIRNVCDRTWIIN